MQSVVVAPLKGPNGQFLPGNEGSRGILRGRFDVQALLVAKAAERPEIIDKLLDMASAGDFRAIEYTIDRLAGKPVQRTLNVEISAQWTDMLGSVKTDLAAMVLGSVVDGQLADTAPDALQPIVEG